MSRVYEPGGRKILLIDVDGTLVDYVTEGVDQDGLYHAFEYLKLI